jgi:hypothetical protein
MFPAIGPIGGLAMSKLARALEGASRYALRRYARAVTLTVTHVTA